MKLMISLNLTIDEIDDLAPLLGPVPFLIKTDAEAKTFASVELILELNFTPFLFGILYTFGLGPAPLSTPHSFT